MQIYADEADEAIRYSTIKATIQVVQEIRNMCSKKDTYNDFLIRMLNFVKKHQREFMKDNKKSDVTRLQRETSKETGVIKNVYQEQV